MVELDPLIGVAPSLAARTARLNREGAGRTPVGGRIAGRLRVGAAAAPPCQRPDLHEGTPNVDEALRCAIPDQVFASRVRPEMSGQGASLPHEAAEAGKPVAVAGSAATPEATGAVLANGPVHGCFADDKHGERPRVTGRTEILRIRDRRLRSMTGHRVVQRNPPVRQKQTTGKQ